VTGARVKGLTATSIEWCMDLITGRRGFSWNFVDGCEPASTGCDFCYAEGIARRFAGSPAFPHGFALTLREDRLDGPLHRAQPARIFVNSMSDLGLSDIPVDLLVRAWAVMARCPHHTFLLLTKRPTVLRTRLSKPGFAAAVRALVAAAEPGLPVVWPLPNVQVGVSVEDQHQAWRIWELLRIPAALHWVSAEPLIGPVDPTRIARRDGTFVDALAGEVRTAGGELVGACPAAVRWVVAGGESGAARGIRPMRAEWAVQLREQCAQAGASFFFKQLGTRLAAELGVKGKGSDWDALPAEFRHRAYPTVPASPVSSRGGQS
jgi:protein gp37